MRNEFAKLSTTIFGISRDDAKSHQNFIRKQKLKIDLIVDTEEILCNQFQVMNEKSMFGKTIRGIERSTFIIDKNGAIIHEWRKVKVPGHAHEVRDYMLEHVCSK